MRPTRLFACALASVLLAGGGPARAQSWPARPVHLIAPSSPGGALDVLSRLISPYLSQKWGQQLVVENKSGATGIIGIQQVARADPDGYTLIILTNNFTILPFIFQSLPYRTPDSFAAITTIGVTANLLLASPQAPFRTVAGLVDFARAHPGQVKYVTSGIGSTGHLSVALLEQMTGIRMVHVPARGAGDLLLTLERGDVGLAQTSVGASMPAIKGGQAIPMAVTTQTRSPALPDVPTLGEAGVPGYDVPGWYALFAPAGTPREIIDKIRADVVEAVHTPELSQRLADIGFYDGGMSSDALDRLVRDELKKWERTARDANIPKQP